MSGPERPTLYNSSTPASRASAAREHAPCSRLSWSDGPWGNSKRPAEIAERAESSCNNPRVGFVNDINHLSTCTAAAGLRRTAWRKRHDPVQKLYSRKSLHFFRLTFGGHSKRPTSPSLAEIAGIRPVVGGTNGGSVS